MLGVEGKFRLTGRVGGELHSPSNLRRTTGLGVPEYSELRSQTSHWIHLPHQYIDSLQDDRPRRSKALPST